MNATVVNSRRATSNTNFFYGAVLLKELLPFNTVAIDADVDMNFEWLSVQRNQQRQSDCISLYKWCAVRVLLLSIQRRYQATSIYLQDGI
jgi:hypothetical protein